MKGLIKVTPESLRSLVESCAENIQNFNKEDYARKEMKWSWRKLKAIEWTVYNGLPFWYQYKEALLSHLNKLLDMAKHAENHGDEIWLSELSYCHLIKLSSGHKRANPIFIMNY